MLRRWRSRMLLLLLVGLTVILLHSFSEDCPTSCSELKSNSKSWKNHRSESRQIARIKDKLLGLINKTISEIGATDVATTNDVADVKKVVENLRYDVQQVLQASADSNAHRVVDNIETEALSETKACEGATTPACSVDYGLKAVHKQVKEMWYFMHSQKQQQKIHNDDREHIEKSSEIFFEDVRARKNVALVEVELMQEARNPLRDRWLHEMKLLVQKKIKDLQEPRNCTTAKKLICDLNEVCGLGCQLHHVAICFVVAIGTGRTLILDSTRWIYGGSGWEAAFLPLSSKRCDVDYAKAVWWKDGMKEEDISSINAIRFGSSYFWARKPPYLPLRIPSEIAETLIQHHGDPSAWWMGQLIAYLIRPQPWFQNAVSSFEETIGFDHPIAGIHVRRTDKVPREAASHDISEYMVHVIDWFDKESLKRQRTGKPTIQTRLVYIASDDETVLEEAKRRYPEYQFLGDRRISINAGVGRRYSLVGLVGIISDITILAKCDYFVGTFSSGMSRAVYEMRQVYHGDASASSHSLDDLYLYNEQFPHQQAVVYDHVSPSAGEIDMVVGDVISTRGNHWDGYSVGTNERTGLHGLYPSYKTQEIITTSDFSLELNDKSTKLHDSEG